MFAATASHRMVHKFSKTQNIPLADIETKSFEDKIKADRATGCLTKYYTCVEDLN